METLEYDVKEFEDLFTESADPADRTKNKKKKTDTSQKKSVQVIDGKRSMNGGIILARLKVEYSTIARAGMSRRCIGPDIASSQKAVLFSLLLFSFLGRCSG